MEAPQNSLEPTPDRSNLGAFKIGLVLLLLVGTITALLLTSDAGDVFVYSKRVDEVMADPSAFMDRRLRVEGELVQGSILFREDPCEWRFSIESRGEVMEVRFPECVVPDTFRDGFELTVTAQGMLSDGHFVADEIIPRCPSKYEMNQRMQNGEAMPHAAPTALNEIVSPPGG